MHEEGMEQEKLWKGPKKSVNLCVSILGKNHVFHIGKDVLRVLGAPKYVSIKLNQTMDSFIVLPIEEKEPMSFRVPDNLMFDNNKKMCVKSQSFVMGLLAANDLDIDRTYRIEGTYSEKNNVVVFNMADCIVYGENNPINRKSTEEETA